MKSTLEIQQEIDKWKSDPNNVAYDKLADEVMRGVHEYERFVGKPIRSASIIIEGVKNDGHLNWKFKFDFYE